MGNKIIGLKQSVKAVESGRAKTVYIAEDAEDRIVGQIIDLCNEKMIKIIYVDNMKQLGKACGVSVSTAVACLVE